MKEVVYYRDKTGAHFGYLMERGYKWAYVEVCGKRKRVPATDVKAWPPPKPDFTTANVKRGR